MELKKARLSKKKRKENVQRPKGCVLRRSVSSSGAPTTVTTAVCVCMCLCLCVRERKTKIKHKKSVLS